MKEKLKNSVGDLSLIAGAGTLGFDTLADLPLDISEPIGLALTILGAVLKLVRLFR